MRSLRPSHRGPGLARRYRSAARRPCRRPGSAALLALLALTACAAPRPPAENIVVVLVDTLRADHLSLYGSPRETAPRLSAWTKREGIVFANARAQAPCTFPSVNSILTSQVPGTFLARAEGGRLGIPAGMPSLAKVLAKAGYQTAAVSASPIVRATPSKQNTVGGFGVGFASFDERCLWREARCVTKRAREILGRLAPPFFLYVHYMDPHDAYRLPAKAHLQHRFAGPGPVGADREFVREGDPRPLEAFLYGDGPDPHVGASDIAYWRDLYDDEILYWDRELAPLVADIRRLAGDSTVIAVVADHGEEFLEHGSIKHCHTLFDTELRVPMILFVPGEGPRRVAAPVENLDLAPTLLDLVGVAVPHDFQGVSLTRLLTGTGAPRRRRKELQLATFGSLWSVADHGFKLIADGEAETERIYDLEQDPDETRPLASVDPVRRAHLEAELAAWQKLNAREASESGSREVERRLRAVGYLQ